jgi:hypothetical protein
MNEARAAGGRGPDSPHPEDEEFHAVTSGHGYRATETLYTGFNVPQAALNCEVYFWGHPVLGVASAAVYLWRGDKPTALSAEYANHQNFLPFPDQPLGRLELPIGLRHEIVEPLSCQRIAFDDPGAATSFDVTLTGICPPVLRPGGGHLVQPMRTRGTVTLRGQAYAVDGYFSRDRSWGEERSEQRMPVPPITWCVGVFDDRTAFHAVGFDDPETNPEVCRLSGIPPAARLRWGYLLEAGTLHRITDWRKQTRFAPDRLTPRGYELKLHLDDGREVEIAGTVRARLPVSMWPNMITHFCQTEWRMAGRTGWGDAQDIQFNDFIHDTLTARA